MNEPICKQCDNRDTEYRFNGHDYLPSLECVYDMANYPNLRSCPKFKPFEASDED